MTGEGLYTVKVDGKPRKSVPASHMAPFFKLDEKVGRDESSTYPLPLVRVFIRARRERRCSVTRGITRVITNT